MNIFKINVTGKGNALRESLEFELGIKMYYVSLRKKLKYTYNVAISTKMFFFSVLRCKQITQRNVTITCRTKYSKSDISFHNK